LLLEAVAGLALFRWDHGFQPKAWPVFDPVLPERIILAWMRRRLSFLA